MSCNLAMLRSTLEKVSFILVENVADTLKRPKFEHIAPQVPIAVSQRKLRFILLVKSVGCDDDCLPTSMPALVCSQAVVETVAGDEDAITNRVGEPAVSGCDALIAKLVRLLLLMKHALAVFLHVLSSFGST